MKVIFIKDLKKQIVRYDEKVLHSDLNEALYEKDHKHGMPADDGRHIVYYSAVFRTGIFHIDRAYRGNHGKHHKAGSRNS